MGNPIHVIHLVPAAPFGGAQRLVMDLVKAQAASGMKSTLAWLGEPERSKGYNAEAEGQGGQQIRGNTLEKLFAVRKLLERECPDIIHLHLPPPWIVAAFEPKRPTIVTHIHTRPTLQNHRWTIRHAIDSIAAVQTIRKSDHVIFVSGWLQAEWRRAFPKIEPHFTVVHNGTCVANARAKSSDRTEDIVVGCAVRLSSRKGAEEFVQLASEIHKLLPNASYRLAGDGPLRTSLEGQVRQLGLSDRFEFTGFYSDIAEFWRSVDLAVFLSGIDAFGLGLLEPLASGVPTLAFRTGTGSDEILSRCRGVSCATFGDFSDLAVQAAKLAEMPCLRQSMGDAAREDIDRYFSLHRMRMAIDDVYLAASGKI